MASAFTSRINPGVAALELTDENGAALFEERERRMIPRWHLLTSAAAPTTSVPSSSRASPFARPQSVIILLQTAPSVQSRTYLDFGSKGQAFDAVRESAEPPQCAGGAALRGRARVAFCGERACGARAWRRACDGGAARPGACERAIALKAHAG